MEIDERKQKKSKSESVLQTYFILGDPDEDPEKLCAGNTHSNNSEIDGDPVELKVFGKNNNPYQYKKLDRRNLPFKELTNKSNVDSKKFSIGESNLSSNSGSNLSIYCGGGRTKNSIDNNKISYRYIFLPIIGIFIISFIVVYFFKFRVYDKDYESSMEAFTNNEKLSEKVFCERDVSREFACYKWGSWADWGVCDQCGANGNQKRERSCQKHTLDGISSEPYATCNDALLPAPGESMMHRGCCSSMDCSLKKISPTMAVGSENNELLVRVEQRDAKWSYIWVCVSAQNDINLNFLSTAVSDTDSNNIDICDGNGFQLVKSTAYSSRCSCTNMYLNKISASSSQKTHQFDVYPLYGSPNTWVKLQCKM